MLRLLDQAPIPIFGKVGLVGFRAQRELLRLFQVAWERVLFCSVCFATGWSYPFLIRPGQALLELAGTVWSFV